MHQITPFLWFNNNVEEAVNFYTAAFSDSLVVSMHRMGDSVFSATFRLAGKEFYALNGGPMYQFTPAVSFMVACETEAEIDTLWQHLTSGGMVMMPLNEYPFSKKFGWVQDKFGISWQLNFTGSKQHITPALMFVKEMNGKAEEAIGFYSSVFKNAQVLRMAKFEAGEPGTPGTVQHAAFSLDGNEFIAMDGGTGHQFTFSPAISFFIHCTTQDEVDYFWDKLSEGGKPNRCGWLDDKYGITWQVIPDALSKLMYDKDPAKSKRVMDAMMKMTKIEIKGLEEAYNA